MISERDYEHWREHGYVVVKVFDERLLSRVIDNIYLYMPSWEDYRRAPLRYDQLFCSGTVNRTFPFVGEALNQATVHPELRAFAERVIGSTNLMINESQLIGKYAGGMNFDQELHVDYGNTTLVYPKPDEAIIDLPIITYYTDVTLELGPTYIVPQEHTRSDVSSPRHRSRTDCPEMYDHEIAVTVSAGSSLIYSMNTWHRGSAMTAGEGVRFSHHMGFRRRDKPWCGQFTFQHLGGRPEMDAFIQSSSPGDRELVGFPPVGDPYWDEASIAGVKARYPQIDMEPYCKEWSTND